jgi:4-amino-4-deoxy-L-arabinose transferase-like glycosyltransferase
MTTRFGSFGRDGWNWVRRLPGNPDPRSVAVVAMALAFVGYRTWLATQSGFGFHQGWNEGHYALIAHGFLDHPLVPRYGANYIYSVPPLFPYVVAVGFALFGESVLVARLPSILAAGGTIIATYGLGRVVYDDRDVAALGAGPLALLPFFQLYSGRAQTDMLMTFLFTASLGSIIHGFGEGGRRWLVVGGGLFGAAVSTKQPAVLLAGIVFGWLLTERRTNRQTVRRSAVLILASAVALIPLLAWYYVNFQIAPIELVADVEHELLGRTAPFANIPLLVAIGLGMGVTPLVVGLIGYRVYSLWRDRRHGPIQEVSIHSSALIIWIIVYGAFVLYRTPSGHQYYLIAMLPAFALVAARGFRSIQAWNAPDWVPKAVAMLVVASAIGGTGVLFELSGEYSYSNGGGERVAADTADWIGDEHPSEVTVLVVNEYRPPIQWYLRSDVESDRIRSYLAADLTPNRLARVRASAEGPVYLVYPVPS